MKPISIKKYRAHKARLRDTGDFGLLDWLLVIGISNSVIAQLIIWTFDWKVVGPDLNELVISVRSVGLVMAAGGFIHSLVRFARTGRGLFGKQD